MLKVLVKKQLGEVFRSYFYDAKKNRMRSKLSIAAWFVFFFLIMVVFLGGVFLALAFTMCGGLTEAGMDWLYFLLMGVIAVLLGAFGSVFNTFSSLYLAKDNDQLLSLPIPVRTIVAARLVNVYLMGTMYSSTVLIPMLIVYWVTVGATAARVICGLLLYLIVTFIVLLLSCLLGWVVAKISVKLKNKSMITVLISLAFIGGYYFFYFKANEFITDIITRADAYGARIRGAAYGLYLFGRIGTGDWLAAAVFAAATALLTALIWRLLSRSFLSVASGGAAARVRYVEKPVRVKSPFGALLHKELGRFASSPNYILNCGLGILLIPICGVLILLKGQEVAETFNALLAGRPDCSAVILCTGLFMLSAMIDTAAPSVSLEGKSLWIPQSLPVNGGLVLRAKAALQLLLSGVPMLFASVCTAAAAGSSLPVKLMIVAASVSYTAFSALFGTFIGLKMPILHWTSEMAPIKQSGAVIICLFGGWVVSMLLGALYVLFGYRLGAAAYLLLWTLAFDAASLLLLRWLNTKGEKAFAEL